MKTSSPSLLSAIVGYDPWLPVLVCVNYVQQVPQSWFLGYHSNNKWRVAGGGAGGRGRMVLTCCPVGCASAHR